MKNLKPAAMGFVAGALCMVSVTAMAAAYPDVTAKLWNDVTFKINGTGAASPSDQPALNYNGYTYVPLRFITETLGGEASFDAVSKTVSVDIEPQIVEKEVEVIKEVPVSGGSSSTDNGEESEEDKYSNYDTLPQRSSKNNYTVEVTGVTRSTYNNTTKILVNVDNKEDSSDNLQLVPSKSKLTVNGNEVSLTKVNSLMDNSWYLADIQPDEEKDGFVTFDLVEDGIIYCDLELTIRNNTSGGEDVHTFKFKVDVGTDD